jgi:hypothetical protein
MNEPDEPIQFFKFLTKYTGLFTIGALFAAFFYYVVNLLKDPTMQMNNLTFTNMSLINSQDPKVTQIVNQVFSLQSAAVVSFLIFAAILISIILIAFRYDLITKLFACLIGILLFFSAIYLYYTFSDAIFGVFSVFLMVVIIITYQTLLKQIKNEWSSNKRNFLIYFFSTLIMLFIILAEVYILSTTLIHWLSSYSVIPSSLNFVVYVIVALMYSLMGIMICLFIQIPDLSNLTIRWITSILMSQPKTWEGKTVDQLINELKSYSEIIRSKAAGGLDTLRLKKPLTRSSLLLKIIMYMSDMVQPGRSEKLNLRRLYLH